MISRFLSGWLACLTLPRFYRTPVGEVLGDVLTGRLVVIFVAGAVLWPCLPASAHFPLQHQGQKRVHCWHMSCVNQWKFLIFNKNFNFIFLSKVNLALVKGASWTALETKVLYLSTKQVQHG